MPDSISFVNFPVAGTREDRVTDGGWMNTSFTLFADGKINAITQLSNSNNVRGFTGGVAITLTDASGNFLWSTEQHQYGLGATGLRRKKTRTENWTAQVPSNILPLARGYGLIQEHTPRDRFSEWIQSQEGRKVLDLVLVIFGGSTSNPSEPSPEPGGLIPNISGGNLDPGGPSPDSGGGNPEQIVA